MAEKKTKKRIKKPTKPLKKLVELFSGGKKDNTPLTVAQNGSTAPQSGGVSDIEECNECKMRHKSVCRKQVEPCKCDSCRGNEKASLDELIDAFDEHRYLYDREALEITCAAVIANFFPDSPPVWLLLIGTSGSGKTDFLEIFRDYDLTQFESHMTGQTLFSGKPGVPHKIWQFNDKCIFVKDLAPMQGGGVDDLKTLFNILRDAYDGICDWSWGSGQKDAHWEGKFGLISASTFAIDDELWKFAQLGERYIRVSLATGDDITTNLTQGAQSNRHGQGEARSEMQLKGHAFLNNLIVKAKKVSADNPIKISNEIEEQLRAISIVGATLRTPVRMTNQGEYVKSNQPEEPTRLVKQLGLLAESSALLHDRDHVTMEDVELVLRVASDGIMPRRKKILRALLEGLSSQSKIASHIGVGASSTIRDLEMLQQIKVVIKGEDSEWRLRGEIADLINRSGLAPRILSTDLSWLANKDD